MKKCLDTRKLHVFTVSFNNSIARPALGFKSELDLVSQVELQVCCGHNHLPNIFSVKNFPKQSVGSCRFPLPTTEDKQNV